MKIPTERDKFDTYFKRLLTRGDSNSQRLWMAVQKMLYRFHLQHSYSVSVIFSEVYARGIKFVESGGVIEVPGGWIRNTSYNVVREMSRAQKKNAVFLEDRLCPEENSETEDEALDLQHHLVMQAFDLLSPAERKLLTLRILEGLPWQLIHSMFNESADTNIKEATLRKRKERAIKNLKKHYQALQHTVRQGDSTSYDF